MDGLQRSTFRECFFPNIDYRIRDMDRLQSDASYKGVVLDFSYRIRDIDRLQRGTDIVFATSYYSIFCEL